MMRIKRTTFLLLILLPYLLIRSDFIDSGSIDRVRGYTRPYEFDYVSWTIKALENKLVLFTLGGPRYLDFSQQKELVETYLDLEREIDGLKRQIRQIYSDPQVEDPATDAAVLLEQENQLVAIQQKLAPLAEGVLQQQVSATVSSLDLAFIGQPVPPILYRVTPLPLALIVSPRDIIRQDANISVLPDLSLSQVVELEKTVESGLNVSALVEEVGGIGMYPTMVMSTTDLNFLVEVVAHEWIHNYLTLRPLGMNYDKTPELRTMNETVASIAGKEIAEAVIAEYYPERIRVVQPDTDTGIQQNEDTNFEPEVFDFRAEMNITRVRADELLADGQIEEAEAYMEARRQFFWENGYQIRRLNQAYFAFHGAYADLPGGAAGEDPVGPAVRKLRESSNSLRSFLAAISGMVSFEELQSLVGWIN